MLANMARAAAVVAVLAVAASACARQEAAGGQGGEGPFTRVESDYLGTVISIAVHDTDVEKGEIDALLDKCFGVVGDIDARMSANRPDSEVARFNQAGVMEPAAVSEDVFNLIGQSIKFSALSGGAFDISVGSVMELWKVDGEFARLPAPEEIQARLPLVDYTAIRREPLYKVRLAKPGMKLDLGAIAKGYACDMVVQTLRDAGVGHAIIDMGGNIFVIGPKPDGSDWRVGIRAPMRGENGIVCKILLSDAAAVTSGGYERCFEQGGKVYNHLLDTRTGYPADSGLLSVTIIMESSSDADAYSTSCFMLGLEKGMEMLRYSEAEGIFITDGMEIHTTPGLRGRVEVTDGRFTLVD
jgi:thiamine biosynthesis lipoprotein